MMGSEETPSATTTAEGVFSALRCFGFKRFLLYHHIRLSKPSFAYKDTPYTCHACGGDFII